MSQIERELMSPGASQEAQDTIAEVVSTPARHLQVASERGLPPSCVVPIHPSPERLETIKTTFDSIAGQKNPNDETPTVVLPNNGVDESGIRNIVEYAREVGVPLVVVDATPRSAEDKNAAFARNEALAHIGAQRGEDPRLRGPIALIDSDSAYVEHDGLDHLQRVLEENPRAQSANGAVSLVPDVRVAYESQRGSCVDVQNPRKLPELWLPDGAADVASIVAFSSQIAGKTTGQLMRPGAVGPQNKYVQMPNGSAEDMIAALYQNKKGSVYAHGGVHIVDQDRTSPEASFAQQQSWGEDHVYLVDALSRVGGLAAGITVLEPTEGGWRQWTVPNSEEISGVVVNPRELAMVAEWAIKHSDCIDDLGVFDLGLRQMRNVLALIEQGREGASATNRQDLPKPVAPTEKVGRYAQEAQIGRLYGNMNAVQILHSEGDEQTIPPTFLYGMRQSASW